MPASSLHHSIESDPFILSFIQAAAEGDIATVRLHIITKEINALNINSQDEAGNTALINAVENRHLEVVVLLMTVPGILQYKNNDNTGRSARSWARMRGYEAILEVLKENVLSVNQVIEQMGQDCRLPQAEIYAILFAAYNNSYYLASPFGINIKNDQGRTAVITATIFRNYDALKWMCTSDDLLYFGGFLRDDVNFTTKDESNKQAIDYAVERRDDGQQPGLYNERRIQDLLVEYGPAISFKTVCAATAVGNARFLLMHCKVTDYTDNLTNDIVVPLLKNIVLYGPAIFHFWKDVIKEFLKSVQRDQFIDATEVMLNLTNFKNLKLVKQMFNDIFSSAACLRFDYDKVAGQLVKLQNPALLAWFVIQVLNVNTGNAFSSTMIFCLDKRDRRWQFNPISVASDRKKLMQLLILIPAGEWNNLFASAKVKLYLQEMFAAIDKENKIIERALSDIKQEQPVARTYHRNNFWMPVDLDQLPAALASEEKAENVDLSSIVSAKPAMVG
jgi:ankyrin repeat protein